MDYSRFYPVIAFQAHGALGKWWIHKTYANNTKNWGIYQHHGRIICKYAYPYDNKTEMQLIRRNFLSYAVDYWHTFSEAEKQYYAEKVGRSPLSGYNYYIGLYLRANKGVPSAGNYLLCEDSDIMITENSENIELE
jgi:hypothetical protein